MKKSYIKPMLFAESLSASSSPSAACEGIANAALLQCSVMVPDLGWMLYTKSIADCEITGIGEDLICYHNPTDENNVFSS